MNRLIIIAILTSSFSAAFAQEKTPAPTTFTREEISQTAAQALMDATMAEAKKRNETIAVKGGVPMLKKGVVIGGLGVSGAAAHMDEEIAMVAATAVFGARK